MDWIELKKKEQLEAIKRASFGQPVLIYKHSTRCGTSTLVKNKLERKWNINEAGELKTYYLDLINNRDISNQIASEFGVFHESPQVLIIRNGKSVYDASHFWISYSAILEHILVKKNQN